MLKLEVNIALIPEPRLADCLARVSQDMAGRHGAIVRLGQSSVRLSLAPHLTLYQAAIPVARLPELSQGLTRIAATQCTQHLASIGLAYNKEEGSLEDGKEVSDSLVALQEQVIALASPLREGLLLERDPAGNRVADLLEAPGRLGENIRATGYGEVGDPRTGGLFRPHDTLIWLTPGKHVDLPHEQDLVDKEKLSGGYSAIGLFLLGPHGTCPQRLGEYGLAACESAPGQAAMSLSLS